MQNQTSTIDVRPATGNDDWHWLRELWCNEWGGEMMVSRGRVHRLEDQKALIAWQGGDRVGSATYMATADDCELTSINAIEEGQGIGSALLQAVEEAARKAGSSRLWLITTNDNLQALRFYQRRGYRLVAVHAGSIDEARRLKPTIPELGIDAIPIHDEIELEKRFASAC